jgi:N-acetylglutamate synthase-like GNAT family acetyltransferase
MKKFYMITRNNKVVACCANYVEAYEISIFMSGSSIQEFFLSDKVMDQASKVN